VTVACELSAQFLVVVDHPVVHTAQVLPEVKRLRAVIAALDGQPGVAQRPASAQMNRRSVGPAVALLRAIRRQGSIWSGSSGTRYRR
jgi:hypothetical protein